HLAVHLQVAGAVDDAHAAAADLAVQFVADRRWPGRPREVGAGVGVVDWGGFEGFAGVVGGRGHGEAPRTGELSGTVSVSPPDGAATSNAPARSIKRMSIAPECPTATELADFHAGRLSDDRIAAVGEHLDACAGCRAAPAAAPLAPTDAHPSAKFDGEAGC